MDCLKANNFVVHSAMLPGMYVKSTHNTVSFMPTTDEGDGDAGRGDTKNPMFANKAANGSKVFNLRTLYIPFDRGACGMQTCSIVLVATYRQFYKWRLE